MCRDYCKHRIKLICILCLFLVFGLFQTTGIVSRAAEPALNRTELKITRRRTFQLKLKNAKGKVTWKSSNKSVAVVDEKGLVTAKKAGKCVIKAKYKGTTYRCRVRVYKYSIYWTPDMLKEKYSPEKDSGKIILAGSSYMEYWADAKSALAPFEILKMGIASTKIEDWMMLYKELIVPYNPKAVVICSGDNNMNGGKNSESGEDTAKKAIELLNCLREELPGVPIYYVAPAPNIRRFHVWDQYVICGYLVRKFCESHEDFYFIDCAPKLLKRGRLQKNLYEADDLHLNKKGYKIWGRVIGNRLRKDLLTSGV